MPTRRNEKQNQMFVLVEQYLQSKQTQSAFCRSADISVSTLHFWLRRYRLTHSKPSLPPPPQNQSFVPLTITQPITLPSASYPGISIRYPNGVIIQINGALDTQQILKLVHGGREYAL